MLKVILKIASGLLLLSVSVGALALTSDNQQPVAVDAGSAELNDAQGIAVYRSNVTITQGSLRITADNVTIHHQNGKVSKAVATGSPAHYQQLPDGKQQPVKASANTIEYFGEDGKVLLLGNAKLEQDGNTLEGSRVVYDIKHKVGNAGGTANTTQTENGRVKMVFQPKTKTNIEQQETKP